MNKKDLWDSKHYEQHSSPQQQSAIRILDAFPFKGNETVLDIGCGDGKITKEICKKVPQGAVFGIDPSENMILSATKNFGSIENLFFFKFGAQNFTFDFQFDLIVSFFAMHYVKDHKKALKNIYDGLKPGGTFIMLMAGGGKKEIEEILEKEKWKKLLAIKQERWHAKTETEYRPMLKETGFTKINTKTVSFSSHFEKKDDLTGWLLGWVPYVTGAEGQEAIQVSQEMAENIAKDKEKNIEMSSPFLYVQAVK